MWKEKIRKEKYTGDRYHDKLIKKVEEALADEDFDEEEYEELRKLFQD